MGFLDRMAAAEEIAARYRAGEVDRGTAEVELFLAWEGTTATESVIRSYLNDWVGPDGLTDAQRKAQT